MTCQEKQHIRTSEITFTTCLAASSAGNPRQDFAAMSEDRASQIPSEAIISLPPARDNYYTGKDVRDYLRLVQLHFINFPMKYVKQYHLRVQTNEF